MEALRWEEGMAPISSCRAAAEEDLWRECLGVIAALMSESM